MYVCPSVSDAFKFPFYHCLWLLYVKSWRERTQTIFQFWVWVRFSEIGRVGGGHGEGGRVFFTLKNLFYPKTFLLKKFFDPKNSFWSKTNFRPKKVFCPKNFFDPKSFLDPKNFFDQNYFLTQKMGEKQKTILLKSSNSVKKLYKYLGSW